MPASREPVSSSMWHILAPFRVAQVMVSTGVKPILSTNSYISSMEQVPYGVTNEKESEPMVITTPRFLASRRQS